MTKIIDLDKYRAPDYSIRKEGNPAQVHALTDHKLLKYQATSEGLTYRQYRERLRLLEIPLEVAIENTRQGITVNDYLKQLEKNKRRFRTGIGSAMLAAAAGLVIAILNPGTDSIDPRVSAAQEKYRRAAEGAEMYRQSMSSPRFRTLDEVTQGQTQYYAILARQQERDAREELDQAQSTDYFVRFGFQ